MDEIAIRKHVKTIMRDYPSDSETHRVLKDLSNWIKSGINIEYGLNDLRRFAKHSMEEYKQGGRLYNQFLYIVQGIEKLIETNNVDRDKKHHDLLVEVIDDNIEASYIEYGEQNFYEHEYFLKAEFMSQDNGMYIYKMTRKQKNLPDSVDDRVECVIVKLTRIPKSCDLRDIWEAARK